MTNRPSDDATAQSPELALDGVLDAIGSGGEFQLDHDDDAVADAVEAAEMLADRGRIDDVPVDLSQRDHVIREARRLWGIRPAKRRKYSALKLIATMLLGLVIVTSVVVVRSQSALPGDRLWTVKRWTEGARQWFARGEEAEVVTALSNTEERLIEAETLISLGRRQVARSVIFEFYREFEEVKWRLRDMSPDRYPEFFARAEDQSRRAVEIERRVTEGELTHEAPVAPSVGTRSPTPRPPWLPASPEPGTEG